MASNINLSFSEKERLQRILAYDNLERQKYAAFLLMAGAPLTIIPGLAIGYYADLLLVMVPLAIGTATLLGTLGAARLGYYKLFRLIQATCQDPAGAQSG